MPQGRARGHLDLPGLSPRIRRQQERLPAGGRGRGYLRQAGEARPLHAGAAPLARLTGGGRFKQGGIQAQVREPTGLHPRGGQQAQHGVAAVAQANKRPTRQPAGQLLDRLSGPVRPFFVATALGRRPLGRGGQHGEHGQGSNAGGPGQGREQADTEPAQTAALDQVSGTAAHRIAVAATSGDARPLAAFEGFVQAEDERASGYKGRHELGQ